MLSLNLALACDDDALILQLFFCSSAFFFGYILGRFYRRESLIKQQMTSKRYNVSSIASWFDARRIELFGKVPNDIFFHNR